MVVMVLSYCTVDDVKKTCGIKPKNLGFKENETDFDSLIADWISQSEDLINSYCNKEWENEVPETVRNVCARLVSNMIAFRLSRGENPIKKVNDYTTKIYSSEIFTEDLRRDLKPFKKSSRIKVFKI